MNIVHIASEFAPIAKVGGLGDVLYGLSKAQVRMGHSVRVFLPKYDCIDYHLVKNLKAKSTYGQFTLWSAELEGVQLQLIEAHQNSYYERGTIYGEDDDKDRFLFFSKSVATLLEKEPIDVVYLHDWPASACALLLPHKKIFTIHNAEFQGKCTPDHLEKFAIPFDAEEISDPIQGEEINLMKGALLHCDAITAVSPTYAKEIQTSDFGFGLEGVFSMQKEKLHGILNGIDTGYWNAETDPFLVENYTFATHKEGKAKNKLHIQNHLGLAQDETIPLVIAITRLTNQKGPDLIHFGMKKVAELGGQFALLGSTNDPEMKKLFQSCSEDPNIAVRLDYDEPLAHLLYASADMLLMPSLFEPCGLAQMIAMRFGTLPLVRKTGGLKDTVFEGKNGFSFVTPDNKEVANVLERAFAAFGTESWDAMIQQAMETDFSWDKSAAKYLELLD